MSFLISHLSNNLTASGNTQLTARTVSMPRLPGVPLPKVEKEKARVNHNLHAVKEASSAAGDRNFLRQVRRQHLNC